MVISQGFISRMLLVAFITSLAVVPLSILLYPRTHQEAGSTDILFTRPQQELVASLSITPTLVIKHNVLQKKIAAVVTNMPTQYLYTSLDGSFSFTYPSEWKVNDQKNNNFYTFSFSYNSSPSGQNMNILVLDPARSAQDVIAKNYPQFKDTVMYEKAASIGDKVVYKITSEDSNFGAFGIVLGQKHVYVISFDDNGNRNTIDQIEKEIWPNFRFK